jgi:hypothetical protein
VHPRMPDIVRRFPLIGRPRPDCPPIHDRITGVAERLRICADGAGPGPVRGAANALNELALFASDWRLRALAAALCWEQIDVYRSVPRPLTVQETRWMLEPVVNLARLAIRDRDGDHAVELLEQVHHAVAGRIDLTVDGRVLPIAAVAGTVDEHDNLLAFVRVLLLTEGIRALALAGRWDDAHRFAVRYDGVESRLTEGRQVAVIAAAAGGDPDGAVAVLRAGEPADEWEKDVAVCLHLLCREPEAAGTSGLLNGVSGRYLRQRRERGFASYQARLGVSIALLAQPVLPDLAAQVLGHAADVVIASGDGYGARDLSGAVGLPGVITVRQREKLTALVTAAGFNGVSPDDAAAARLSDTAAEAVRVLTRALHTATTAA